MKRLLTKSIVTGILAGTMLAPTAAHAFPYNPIGIVRGAGDMLGVRLDPVATATSAAGTIRESLPVDPVEKATSAAGNIWGALPADLPVPGPAPAYTGDPTDVVRTATSAAGTIKEAAPVDLKGLPLPVSAVTVPPMLPVPCRITPPVHAPVEIAQRLASVATDQLC